MTSTLPGVSPAPTHSKSGASRTRVRRAIFHSVSPGARTMMVSIVPRLFMS